jgi:hypothetical protein
MGFVSDVKNLGLGRATQRPISKSYTEIWRRAMPLSGARHHSKGSQTPRAPRPMSSKAQVEGSGTLDPVAIEPRRLVVPILQHFSSKSRVITVVDPI